VRNFGMSLEFPEMISLSSYMSPLWRTGVFGEGKPANELDLGFKVVV